MTAAHTCPGGCRRKVPNYWFACPPCWRRLPRELRTPITASFRRDPSAHVRAMARAADWYARHPREATLP